MAPPTRELPVRVGAGLQLLLPSFWAQATQGPPSSARHDPPSSLPCPLEQLQKLRRTPGSTASPRSQPGPSTCLHATLVSLLPSDGGSLDETQEVLRTAPGAALICSCLSPQQEKVGARAAGRMSPARPLREPSPRGGAEGRPAPHISRPPGTVPSPTPHPPARAPGQPAEGWVPRTQAHDPTVQKGPCSRGHGCLTPRPARAPTSSEHPLPLTRPEGSGPRHRAEDGPPPRPRAHRLQRRLQAAVSSSRHQRHSAADQGDRPAVPQTAPGGRASRPGAAGRSLCVCPAPCAVPPGPTVVPPREPHPPRRRWPRGGRRAGSGVARTPWVLL